MDQHFYSEAVAGILNRIIEVEQSLSTVLTNKVISVPSNAHSFVIKRLPINAKVTVNGDTFTVDEPDKIGIWNEGIKTFTITTTATHANPFIVQFIV